MRTMIALAAATALALPLAGQHGDHQAPEGTPRRPPGMMQHEGGMGMPLMMEIHTFSPQALLERSETLGLTPEQVQRLTTLQTETRAAHERTHPEVQARFAEAKTAWDAGNMQAATAATQAGMQAMQAAHLGMQSAAGQARAILTGEQRARVQGWMDMRQMRVHEMQQRGERMRQRMPRPMGAPRRGG